MIDIASVSLAQPLDTIADELGRSFGEYGFAVVRDHGIPQDLIDRAEAASRPSSRCPTRSSAPTRSPAAAARAATRPSAPRRPRTPRCSISRSSGTSAAPCPKATRSASSWPRMWPAEVEGFRETMSALFAAFETTGARVLEAIALHLGRPRDFFAASIEDGNSVMRLLHYPPLGEGAPEGRSAPPGTRTSTPSRCSSGPRRPGSSCSPSRASGTRSRCPRARW